MGFEQHEYVRTDNITARSKILQELGNGVGVFAYFGHGSGSGWITPEINQDDVHGLANVNEPFFSLDCSCENGAFQTFSPCMAEALLTTKGGAIATMMSAPEIDMPIAIDYLRA